MLCYTCLKANSEKLSWAANADAAFTDRSYAKDATVRFSTHEASSGLKEALLKVITLPALYLYERIVFAHLLFNLLFNGRTTFY